MRDASLLGPWVRRFLMEHMVGERNLARNTQRSYRDTLRLLLPAVAQRARKPIDRLAVDRRVGRPRATVPERPGGEAGLRDRHPEPAAGRDPRPGPLHRRCTLRSWSSGAGRCARCRSRRPRGRWSRTWRRRRWMPCSRRRTRRRPRAVGIMPCSCSCTTPGLGPMKRPRPGSAT